MSTDAALSLLSGLVLDDGRRWGQAAVDWQIEDARAVLTPDDGTPRLHWLGRPKGASKSTDLAALSCVWLVEQAPPMAEGFAVAADSEQANRLLDKARGFIARTPELRRHLTVEALRIVNTNTGSRVQALAADVAGSEGLLTPWIVVDELPNWLSTPTAKRMWVSVFSAVPKWKGARLTVIGHAGDPAHWSYRVLEQARRSSRWRVHEIEGPLEWLDPAALDEQRAMLLPSEFERRHMNRWTAAEDRLTTVDDLRQCVTLDGPLGYEERWRYVAALDVGLTNDRTVVCVVHREPVVRDEGLGRPETTTAHRIVLDRLMVWQGSRAQPVQLAQVEDYLSDVNRVYKGVQIVFDPWQAQGSAQRLRGRGLRLREFTFSASSVGRIATTLHSLIRQHQLALPDDEALLDELATVRLRQTAPGVVKLDHENGKHDDMAVALALAAHTALEQPMAPSWSPMPLDDGRRPATIVGNLFGTNF